MNPAGTLCAHARELTKRFGHVVALDGLDLDIKAGEVLGLIGPSGSGKTSFVKVLVGILTPDAGEASVFGERMPNREVLSRVGYMAQADALYDDISALDNLVYFATLEGMHRGAAKLSAMRLIDFVGLSGHEKRRVREYSGGMRKRLSLAIALVHDPELFVLDEPTVGVDPHLRQRFWNEFADLAARGKAIIATTHIMDEAERCDRLALIFGGKVIATGSPAEIRSAFGVTNLEDVFLKATQEGAAS